MNKIDWSKAPKWATCVVKPLRVDGTDDYHWCENLNYDARLVRVTSGAAFRVGDKNFWTVVEYRPLPGANAVEQALDFGTLTHQLIEKINDDRLQQCMKAPDLLNQAAQLLAERGQQYDKEGEERSAAAIVAAFNAVTKRDLTPGEGWLFMVLLKAVRFYSNTETPHRDSLEDMIAYTALHAEEYLRK